MLEAMSRDQQFFGFKPLGEHRPFSNATMHHHHAPCATCDGSGIRDGDTDDTWRHCPACEGLGRVWTSSLEVVDAARAAVAERYPDAVASHRLPMPTSDYTALDLGSSTVIDLRRDERTPESQPTNAAAAESAIHGNAGDPTDGLGIDGKQGEGPPSRRSLGKPRRTRQRRERAKANAAAVEVLITMTSDAELADLLIRVHRNSNHGASSTLYQDYFSDIFQAAFAPGVWRDDDVRDAFASEDGDGWLWLRCCEITVCDGRKLYFFGLDDGCSFVEGIGLFADPNDAEPALQDIGTLNGSFRDGWS